MQADGTVDQSPNLESGNSPGSYDILLSADQPLDLWEEL